MLPLQDTQWVHEELEMLEKAIIVLESAYTLSSSIVIVPMKAELGKYLRNIYV